MRKSSVIAALGSGQAVADLLGISRAAVSNWGDEVPALRAYQLRELRPDLFGADEPAPEPASA